MSIGMRENTTVGPKGTEKRPLGNCTASKLVHSFLQFSEHPMPRFCPYDNVVRKNNIPEKVDALVVWSNTDFFRMQCQLQLLTEESLDRFNKSRDIRLIARDNHEVIGVASVVFYFQLVLHELIEFIHIDIRKKLRGQVAYRDALGFKKIAALRGGAPGRER